MSTNHFENADKSEVLIADLNLQDIMDNLKDPDDSFRRESLAALHTFYPELISPHKETIATALSSGSKETLDAGFWVINSCVRVNQDYEAASEIIKTVLNSAETSSENYDRMLHFALGQLVRYSDISSNPKPFMMFQEVLVSNLPDIIKRAEGRKPGENVSAAVVACLADLNSVPEMAQEAALRYTSDHLAEAATALYDLATDPEQASPARFPKELRNYLVMMAERQVIRKMNAQNNEVIQPVLNSYLYELGADQARFEEDKIRIAENLAAMEDRIVPSVFLLSKLVSGMAVGFQSKVPDGLTYFDAFNLVNDWRNSAAEANSENTPQYSEVVKLNLQRMVYLEECRPGITRVLNEPPFGIANFARYPVGLLLDQFNNRDEELPYGVIFSPKGASCDWNGVFYSFPHIYNSMYQQLLDLEGEGHPRHLIRVVEGEGTDGYNKALVLLNHRYGADHKIEFLLDNGHGSPDAIDRGSYRFDKMRLTREQVDYSRDFRGDTISTSGARRLFEPYPTIILNSCSTGADEAIGVKNIKEALDANVYAPKEPGRLSEVNFVFDDSENLKVSAKHIRDQLDRTNITAIAGRNL